MKKKNTGNNPSDPIIGTIFYLPLWKTAWTTQRSENKVAEKKHALISFLYKYCHTTQLSGLYKNIVNLFVALTKMYVTLKGWVQ